MWPQSKDRKTWSARCGFAVLCCHPKAARVRQWLSRLWAPPPSWLCSLAGPMFEFIPLGMQGEALLECRSAGGPPVYYWLWRVQPPHLHGSKCMQSVPATKVTASGGSFADTSPSAPRGCLLPSHPPIILCPPLHPKHTLPFGQLCSHLTPARFQVT